jgi:hypothetical protein
MDLRNITGYRTNEDRRSHGSVGDGGRLVSEVEQWQRWAEEAWGREDILRAQMAAIRALCDQADGDTFLVPWGLAPAASLIRADEVRAILDAHNEASHA